MQYTRKAWSGIGVLAVTLFCLAAPAGTMAGVSVNPYEWILERNPFGLRPPPPPAEPATAPVIPPAPLATVEVAGITSILSSPRVLLEIVPGPGKPMLKPVLGVGERVDAVEVVSISVERGEVVLRNGNVTTNVPLRMAKAGLPSAPGGPTPTPAQLAGVSPAGSRSGVVLGGGVPVPERRSLPSFPALPQVGRFNPPPNPAGQ
jgi:hypothetical protein